MAGKPETQALKKKEVQEWRDKTQKQQSSVNSVIKSVEQRANDLTVLTQRHNDQSGHLQGYYEEIEKLAKGKTLIPATDLIVERCNEAIRDAKAIVQQDPYLDRVKEFVSAGDNPVYPDVLIAVRTVLESLSRSKVRLQGEVTRVAALLREARTISIATALYLKNDAVPSKEDVEAYTGRADLSDVWFTEDEDGNENFNFDKLDECSIEKYFLEAVSTGS